MLMKPQSTWKHDLPGHFQSKRPDPSQRAQVQNPCLPHCSVKGEIDVLTKGLHQSRRN